MNTLKTYNNDCVPFNVAIISKGDRYGLNNCLTHEEDAPLVEFYDARYPHTPLGQFVTRYCARTLIERESGKGLCLDAGIPAWSIDGDTMDLIQGWLMEKMQ